MNDTRELTDEQCDEFRRHLGTFNNMVRAIYAAGRASMAKVPGWISIDERVPDYDEAVWLKDGDHIYIGGRYDSGEGWLWGKCYQSPHFAKGKWYSEIEGDDDYKATQWMPLLYTLPKDDTQALMAVAPQADIEVDGQEPVAWEWREQRKGYAARCWGPSDPGYASAFPLYKHPYSPQPTPSKHQRTGI